MKRSPIIRKTPLSPISKKEKVRKNSYMKLKKDYLEHHPICEVCLVEPATQIHHRSGRQGKNLLDVTTFLAVSQRCHDLIHQNPKWAMEHGYLIDRIGNKVFPHSSL